MSLRVIKLSKVEMPVYLHEDTLASDIKKKMSNRIEPINYYLFFIRFCLTVNDAAFDYEIFG